MGNQLGIQDFPEMGRQLPNWVFFFAENCMKMKDFGLGGGGRAGGGHVPGAHLRCTNGDGPNFSYPTFVK